MLYIDDREPNEKIQRFRQALGDNNVAVVRTEVADYYVGDFSFGVERKSPSDYVGSFCSKKLFSQATELARVFARPYIVIEGTLRELIFAKRNLHISSLLGSIASLEAHYNVRVLFTAMYNERREYDYFVEVLLKLIDKYTDNKVVDYSPIRDIRRPAASLEEQQLHVIMSLPGIKLARAKALLAHFGTVQNVISASKEELMEVEGIGKKNAAMHHQVTR